MLFRTVYGAELEVIYNFIKNHEPISRHDVLDMLVARPEGSAVRKNQNVDDALSFLKSARLIFKDKDLFFAGGREDKLSFTLRLLEQLRNIERGEIGSEHKLDPLYTYLLNELFIRKNCLFIPNVHQSANYLEKIQKLGGLSREKINSWTRVMEFIGVGFRAYGGFLCIYSPKLLLQVLENWPDTESTLQHFFEDYLQRFLPWQNSNGSLADSIASSLLFLQDQHKLTLIHLQDSPSKAFFHPHNYKAIRKEGF